MPTCPYCGTVVAEEGRFCASCGKALPQVPPTPENPFVPPAPPGQPPRNRSWLPVASGLLLAGAAVAAYLIFFNPSPKRLFLEAQGQLIGAMRHDLEEAMGPFGELQERVQKETYQSTVTLTADFDVSVQDPSAQISSDFLKTSSLVLGTRRDPAADRQLVDFKLTVKGTDLLTGEFYQSPDVLALKVPELHSKYLHLENKDLQQTFQAKGIPYTGPNRILTAQDYQRYLTVDPDRWAPVVKDYARYIHDFIRDDEITLEKGYRYPSPEGEVTMKRVTLTFSEQRVKDFYIGLGRKFKGDEAALDLVADYVGGWARLMIDSGSLQGLEREEMRKLTDKEYVKRQIRDGAADWEQTWNEARLPNGLKIAAVLDSKNNVVEQEMRFTVSGDGEPVDLTLTVTRWNGRNGTRDRNFVASAKTESGGGVLEWRSHTVPRSKSETETTTTVLVRETTGMKAELKARIIGTVVKGAEEGKDRRTYDFTLESDGVPGLKGQVSVLHSSQATGKRFEALTRVVLDMDPQSGFSPPAKVMLNVDSATDLGSKVEFPTFTASNAIHLNRLSRSEWDQLLGELASAAERFLMNNARLFLY